MYQEQDKVYVDHTEKIDLQIATAELERWNKNDGETPRYQVMGMPAGTGFDALLIEEGKPGKFLEIKSRDCSSTQYKPTEYYIRKDKMDFMHRLSKTRSHLIYLFTDCWYCFNVADIVNHASCVVEVYNPVKKVKEKHENYFLDLNDGKRNEYKAIDQKEVERMIKDARRRNI